MGLNVCTMGLNLNSGDGMVTHSATYGPHGPTCTDDHRTEAFVAEIRGTWKAAIATRVGQKTGNQYCNTRRPVVGGFTNYPQPLQQVQRLDPTATTEHRCTNQAIGMHFIRNFNIESVSYGACHVAIPRW